MNDKPGDDVRDDMLMALADGELDAAEAKVLQDRIRRDPALASRYAVFVDTADALRSAFAQDAVPERLIAATAPKVVPVRPGRPDIRWPLALAASLSIGIGLGWGLSRGDPAAIAPDFVAMAQAVSEVPTGQEQTIAGQGVARVLGSFETELGLCRLLAVEPDRAVPQRVVACRQSGDWSIVLSVSDGSDVGFATASDTVAETIDMYLDAIGAGAALDAAFEMQALQ